MAWYWSEAQWNMIVDMAANERRFRADSANPDKRPEHSAMNRRFADNNAVYLRNAAMHAIMGNKRPALIFT